MARNRHPFAGEVARSREAGRIRIWQGVGREQLTSGAYVPARALRCAARVPDLATGKRVVGTFTRGRVKLASPGWKGAKWDRNLGMWFMMTDF